MTSRQEFFGAGVVEAIYCGCFPWLPDRLSYPEHLPADRRDHHLYRTESGFYEGLKQLILNIEQVRTGDYQYFVAPYDWSILAPRYDAFFENLLA